MVFGRQQGVRGAVASRAPRWLSLVVFGLVGCAPAAYAVHETRAERALEHGKRARASERAAYELTLAEAYLVKAREESSHAAYQDAIRLARRSKQNAEEAIERARSASDEAGN